MVNEPKENDISEENALSYAAIVLFRNHAHGPAPQWHELAALHAGSLQPPRSDEVLSHVANDPDYFQQWLDLSEAEFWVEDEMNATHELKKSASDSPIKATDSTALPSQHNAYSSAIFSQVSSLRTLFNKPLPVYGGAFAAMLLAVLIIPLLQNSAAHSLQQRVNRSMDSYIQTNGRLAGDAPTVRTTRNMSDLFDEISVSDVERQYVQNGMRSFGEQLHPAETEDHTTDNTWIPFLSELEAAAPDCDIAIEQMHCIEVADNFRLLGQWTMLNTAACQSIESGNRIILNTDFWSVQYALYDELRVLPDISSSMIFAPRLTALTEKTPTVLCQKIRTVLSATL